jgi:hypothetical protein
MNTAATKQEQNNMYTVLDSMGRPTGIYYAASNMNEAWQAFKEDKDNYQKHYYGRLKRCYNGGVRGSVL